MSLLKVLSFVMNYINNEKLQKFVQIKNKYIFYLISKNSPDYFNIEISQKINTTSICTSLMSIQDNSFCCGISDGSLIFFKMSISDYGSRSKVIDIKIIENVHPDSSFIGLTEISENEFYSYSDNIIKLWKYENSEKKYKFIASLNQSNLSVFKKISDINYVAGYDNSLIVIFTKTQNELKLDYILEEHSNLIIDLLRLEVNVFCSASYDSSVIIWKNYDGKFKNYQTLMHDSYLLCMCKLSNNIFVSSIHGGKIYVWKEVDKRKKKIQVIDCQNDMTTLLKLSTGYFCSGTNNNIVIWKKNKIKYGEIENFSQILSKQLLSESETNYIGFNHVKSLLYLNENHIISGSLDNTITIMDLK